MTRPPTPPARPAPNYALLALAGVLAGLVVVVVVFLLTGGDDEGAIITTIPPTIAATSSSPTATTVATTAPPTSAPPVSLEGSTDPQTAPGDPFATFAFLSDVRAQQREGFTRVVFDFEGDTVPWWSVEYAAGPFVSVADEPIPVGGTAFLRVVLASTSFDLTGAEVRITYDGPEQVAVNTNSVVEIVRTDDFEGSSTWVVGVMGVKPYAVGALTGPARVFVDIAD